MFDAVTALLCVIEHQRAGRLHPAEALLADILRHEPDNAAALFLQGATALALGRPAEAVPSLARAAVLRPGHRPQLQALARALIQTRRPADALQVLAPLAAERGQPEVQFLRGTAMNALGRPAEASAALEDAVAAAPDHADAHLNLGNARADLDDLAGAEMHMRRAVALNPRLPEAHASLGFLLTAKGALDEAIAACQAAIALQPDFAAAHWNQGVAYLLAGRMTEGWALYEWRKQRFPESFKPPPTPQWTGERLAGRTLLVLAEQGFGDTIQLCRYLPPMAQGARVILECAPQLHPLLRSLPRVTLATAGQPRPAHDVWVDQMSLPRLHGTTLDTVPWTGPYLRPPHLGADPVQAGTLRVGLVWAGNPAHSNDRRRSITAHALGPLLAAAPGAFVSLQTGPSAPVITRLYGVGNNAGALTDFGETAALMATLDLVITVDTAIAHLAGALGVPAWVMLPYAPDWRWMLGRADSPWYPTLRLFRQDQPGDWDGVIGRAASALRDVKAGRCPAASPTSGHPPHRGSSCRGTAAGSACRAG